MYCVAVVGSRGFTDWVVLKETLDMLHSEQPIDCIVSGGAKGADTLGERWAYLNGVETRIYKPEWRKNGVYDNTAGIRRNRDIVRDADVVIAFWDHQSSGTASTIQFAQKAGKKVHIILF